MMTISGERRKRRRDERPRTIDTEAEVLRVPSSTRRRPSSHQPSTPTRPIIGTANTVSASVMESPKPHLRHNMRSNVLSSDGAPTNDIHVSYNCLLLPAAVAFWWYWTKRKARKVLRRMHLMAPPAEHDDGENEDMDVSMAYFYHNSNSSDECDDDPFHTWDDVRQGNHGSNSSNHRGSALRWVQWFKGRGGKTTRTRRRVHATTLQHLRQRPSFLEQQQQDGPDPAAAAVSPAPLVLSTELRKANNNLFSFQNLNDCRRKNKREDPDLEDTDESSSWQCIHDTIGGGADFCSAPPLPSSSSSSSASVAAAPASAPSPLSISDSSRGDIIVNGAGGPTVEKKDICETSEQRIPATLT